MIQGCQLDQSLPIRLFTSVYDNVLLKHMGGHGGGHGGSHIGGHGAGHGADHGGDMKGVKEGDNITQTLKTFIVKPSPIPLVPKPPRA